MTALALQTCGLIFAGTLALAALSDLRSRTIPNFMPVLLLVAFIPAAWFAGYGWPQALSHLGAAAMVFAVAVLLFALRVWGGGDAKLVAAVALWIGFTALSRFVVIMALAGGVLALVMLLIYGRRARVPYGIAIAIAGLDWWLAAMLSRGVG